MRIIMSRLLQYLIDPCREGRRGGVYKNQDGDVLRTSDSHRPSGHIGGLRLHKNRGSGTQNSTRKPMAYRASAAHTYYVAHLNII